MTVEVSDIRAFAVYGIWRFWRYAGYDVTVPGDEESFWRYRPFTVEDAITALELMENGKSWQQHDYKFDQPEPSNSPLAKRVRAMIGESYEEELAIREREVVADYADNSHG